MEKIETNVFSTSFVLHSYEIDRNGQAFPHSLMSFLLHSAWQHVANSDFSFDALAIEQNIWVLSRFKLIIDDFPTWGENIKIETWGKGVNGLFAIRDFLIYKTNGDRVASASSAWLVLNRKSLRPQRLHKLNENFIAYPDKHAIPEKLDKIILPGIPDEKERIKTHFSDIDVNKHVSSSNYVKWMIDTFNHGNEDKSLHSLEINYLAEAHTDETIIIKCCSDAEFTYCSIIRETDNAELCRGKFCWK